MEINGGASEGREGKIHHTAMTLPFKIPFQGHPQPLRSLDLRCSSVRTTPSLESNPSILMELFKKKYIICVYHKLI